jgi:glycosyltransferase involved in cell wall biosynthesis
MNGNISPIKIAFISHYTELYGANRSLLNLIDGLKFYDVVPYVISPANGPIIDALKFRNVKYAIVPIQWWIDNLRHEDNPIKKIYQISSYYRQAFKRLYLNFQVISSLADILNGWDVDIIYTNSSATPAGALVAQKLGLPHVWHLREFINIDYQFHFDWGKLLVKYIINQADAQIAISKAIRSHFVNNIYSNRIQVVYNGIASISEFDYLYQLGNSSININRPYTFALVGAIHPNKGQEVAIRALALLVNNFLREIRLLIVGKGDIVPLKKLAHELGIQNQVEFWGHIDDPYKAYLASDAVLMCSKNEGMGRVTVEAMSVCRPVIGYDNAGTSEIIQHEYTGLLHRGEHEALATCMRLFIENPEWAIKLGNNGWHFARKEFNTEIYSEKIYQILLSVLQKKYLTSKDVMKI